MISTYKVFQLIFGLIASIFIITFLIRYSGDYASLEEQSQSVTILKNFNKVAGDVYLTSNNINFGDFSNYGLDECFAYFNEPDSPVIKCANFEYPSYIPMVFRSGDEVMIDGSYIDMGWWKTNFILVYPELRIIFNPVRNHIDSSRMMSNITSLFMCEWGVRGYECGDVARGIPYPTALQIEPRPRFGFCDGDDLIFDSLCDGSRCERFDMYATDYFQGAPGIFGLCSAEMPSGFYSVVTITDNCNINLLSGVCIETSPDGVGRMRIAGSEKVYVYKDILDIMALVIGGDSRNAFGYVADSMYTLKNEVMMRRLAIGAEISGSRADMLAPLTDSACQDLYYQISDALCSGSDSVCRLAKESYLDLGKMTDLRERLNEAEELHSELVRNGCENG